MEEALEILLKQIGRKPLLTRPQEVALAKRIEAGDPTAKRELVESNLPLVVNIAKRYRGNGLPFVDLIQEGSLGLSRAAEGFDWRWGTKFSTTAYPRIERAIQRALDNKSRIIRIPTNVLAVEGRKREYLTSLDQPISDTDTDASLMEIISDDRSEQEIGDVDNAKVVADGLAALTDRERNTIELYFGLEGPQWTQAEIGEFYGVSRTLVAKWIADALEKMRDYLGSA